jgi:hypothetical protein
VSGDAITLREQIMQLCRKLDAAQRHDPAHRIRFPVGPIELEATPLVTRVQAGRLVLCWKSYGSVINALGKT